MPLWGPGPQVVLTYASAVHLRAGRARFANDNPKSARKGIGIDKKAKKAKKAKIDKIYKIENVDKVGRRSAPLRVPQHFTRKLEMSESGFM